MEIIPAILPKDFAELEEKIELVKGLVPLVQVDVCDGKLTPKPCWPYKKHDDNFDAILREDRGLPYWENVDYEMDLMIAEPELEVENWVLAGAKRLIIHYEALKKSADGSTSTPNRDETMHKIIADLQGRVEIGIAISLHTEIDAIAPFINDIDVVQCMGIDKIGFQGQDFNPHVIAKVRELKERFPERAVSVDGGVSLENAAMLRDAGADRLIVGSAIFGNENVMEAVERLENI